jgi:hypothetical protein
MVDAHHQRRAAVVVVDEVVAPQRPVRVERDREQVGGHLLQLGLVVAGGQGGVVQVAVEVEVGIVHPVGGARCIVFDPLPEAAVGQQARFQGAPKPLVVHRAVEDHDADDHHQVGRPVHAQPGGVDGGDALALAHRGVSGCRTVPL